jgi:signal transduction histidine kinase
MLSNVPIRILLVEDLNADADLLTESLASVPTKYEVCRVSRLSEVAPTLKERAFDVILSDLSLPDSDATTTIGRLFEIAQGVPIVALSGMATDKIALTLLDEGAQDYLLKNEMSPQVLDRAIQYAMQRHRGRREIQQLLTEVQQSRQLLERKNRRLAKLYHTAQRFVNNVSHEFRTPLTVIREYTDLLREGVLGDVNEEQSRYLNIVVDRADDLNRMVDDMLDVSKLEVGLLGAWRKRCLVGDIIDHSRPALIRKAELKDVELEFDIPETLPAVYCDAEKAGRVVVNLAVNAIKYSREGGTVKVWARIDESDEGVVIGVTDNGPGIDRESQEAIFKRYKQLGTDCNSSTKGVGLGLNIAQELVELNFGQMRVESQLGQGSTFCFTLPPDEPEKVIRRYLSRMRHSKHEAGCVSFLVASVEETRDPALSDEVDAFFNYLLRRQDLLFHTSSNEWLLIVPEPESELDQLADRLSKQRNEANRNRPNGLLPEISLRRLGTWPANNEPCATLECVAQALSRQELMHA